MHAFDLAQVEGLTRDAGRLANENNQLHLQLLKAADVADKADRDHYQQVKKLEGQVTELACWKHQTAGRFHSLEQENAGLRAKVEDILRLGEKHPRREVTSTWFCCRQLTTSWREAELRSLYVCSGRKTHRGFLSHCYIPHHR